MQGTGLLGRIAFVTVDLLCVNTRHMRPYTRNISVCAYEPPTWMPLEPGSVNNVLVPHFQSCAAHSLHHASVLPSKFVQHSTCDHAVDKAAVAPARWDWLEVPLVIQDDPCDATPFVTVHAHTMIQLPHLKGCSLTILPLEPTAAVCRPGNEHAVMW
jgi:hypothetical protein